jgi:hypothetical protein
MNVILHQFKVHTLQIITPFQRGPPIFCTQLRNLKDTVSTSLRSITNSSRSISKFLFQLSCILCFDQCTFYLANFHKNKTRGERCGASRRPLFFWSSTPNPPSRKTVSQPRLQSECVWLNDCVS